MEGDLLEQAVVVYLRFQEDGFGSPKERDAISDLENKLEQAVESASVGEFDGEEFGGGRCVIYMYGPDADQLFTVVEPILKSAPLVPGGFAIKRYGEAKDASAAEVRVNL